MKIQRACIIVGVLLLCGCAKSNKTIIRMQHMETGVQNPTTIEELKTAIVKYQDRIADIQLANGQIGVWYKLLGTRYLDNKMYGEALKAFQKAVEFYPANQNLYYYVGVCAGWMSKAALDYDATGSNAARLHYQDLAESAYLRALELEPRYVRALLGLSMLYVYETNESEKAVPLLEKLLSIDTKNIDAMFVLAAAYYGSSRAEDAVATCDRIIAATKSADRKQQAEQLKRAILEKSY